MIGEVYELALSDRHGGEAHPHCVVLVASDDQAIIITGFTPDKPAITKVVNAYFSDGIYEHQLLVRVDHRRMTEITTNKPLHEAVYLLDSALPIDRSTLAKRGRRWGRLSDATVRQLITALLAFHDQRRLSLDPKHISELRSVLEA